MASCLGYILERFGSQGILSIERCCKAQFQAFRRMSTKHVNGSAAVGNHLNGSTSVCSNGKLQSNDHVSRRHEGDDFIKDAVPRLLEKVLATYNARDR